MAILLSFSLTTKFILKLRIFVLRSRSPSHRNRALRTALLQDWGYPDRQKPPFIGGFCYLAPIAGKVHYPLRNLNTLIFRQLSIIYQNN